MKPISELLFHGTLEPLNGPLRPGGYDDVFWTAEHSTVAQNYIPSTGGETYASVSRYQMDESIRPSPSNPFYAVATMIGPPATDVRFDDLGRPISWSTPRNFATYQQVVDHLQNEMGYVNRSTMPGEYLFRLRTDGWDAERKMSLIVAADFKKQGSLVIVQGHEGMRFLDISSGDPDLTDLQYHGLKTFRRARQEGYDGVIIDDFAQSKNWGNVGHRSIGFFTDSLARLQTRIIPAKNFDWPDMQGGLQATDTPEFAAWRNANAALQIVQTVTAAACASAAPA